MQERPGPARGNWDREQTEARLAALSSTSKHRAVTPPQRPHGMTRLSGPPETPRVARPQHEVPQPKKSRMRWLIFGTISAIAAIIACTIGYLLASGMFVSSGPTSTAVDFLGALNSKNYDQAYQDLGLSITLKHSQQEFAQQAQDADKNSGAVTDYKEIANSAVTNQDGSQSFTYTITRANGKHYPMKLTLQPDPNNTSTWKIIDYGIGLGPS